MSSSTITKALITRGSQGPAGSGGGGGGIGGSTGTTDNRVLRADGTGGATVQASAVTIDDSGNVSGVGNITLSGTVDGVDIAALEAGLGTASTHAATDFQPADADLTAIAGLTSAADSLPYFTGAGTAALATFTSAGRALVDDADAAAQRTTLGLGTAATTASTDYQPTDAELTAIAGLTSAADKVPYFTGSGTAALYTATTSGRALAGVSWASGTQVPSLTAAGTAGLLTVGTGASNLVQLDGSSKLPVVDGSQLTNLSNSQVGGAVYPADSWTYQWVTGTGDPLSNGWAQAGTVNVTTASATQAGVGCFSLTPGGTSGTSSIKYSTTAATGNWELRLKIYMPASSGTTNNFGFVYNPDTTQSGSKRFQYMFTSSTSSSITYWTGSAMGTLVTTPSLTGRWVDITVRTYVTSTGLANTWQELWVGKTLVWYGMAPSSLGATSPAAGDIVIGRMTASTTVSVIYIAEVSFKDGINTAPVSHTFAGTTWPL